MVAAICAGMAASAHLNAGAGQMVAQAQGDLKTAPDQAEQLLALGNQARMALGLKPLKWDAALAAAAMQHCRRMAAEGSIAHRYGGEAELTARASQAGGHFSLIEENIAVGLSAASIHEGWMNSPHHRTNMLSPDVDAVGFGVVAKGPVIYAVADYAHDVTILNAAQVEAAFAALLRTKGIAVARDAAEARAYCASSGRFNGSSSPSLAMRWQNPDVSRLPADLEKKIASGAYSRAQVGSCPAQDVEGAFTVYRVAVLLYGAD